MVWETVPSASNSQSKILAHPFSFHRLLVLFLSFQYMCQDGARCWGPTGNNVAPAYEKTESTGETMTDRELDTTGCRDPTPKMRCTADGWPGGE